MKAIGELKQVDYELMTDADDEAEYDRITDELRRMFPDCIQRDDCLFGKE